MTSTTHKENRRGRKNMQDVQVVGTCPSRQQTGREQRLVRRAASHLREALRTRQVYQGRGDQLPLLGRLRRLNRMPCPSLEQETPAWGQHGSRTQAGTIRQRSSEVECQVLRRCCPQLGNPSRSPGGRTLETSRWHLFSRFALVLRGSVVTMMA